MGGLLSKPNTTKHTSTGSAGNLEYAASSMQGWRTTMEDAETTLLSLPEPFSHVSFFGVFDGHGGSRVSRYVSENLYKIVAAHPQFGKNYKEAIQSGFLECDRSIFENPDPDIATDTSGCTSVVWILDKSTGTYYCGNAGDSRAVLCRGGVAHPLSNDHKPDDPSERERIEAAGCTVALGRVNGSLALSRAIGDKSFKENTKIEAKDQAVTAFPEVTTGVLYDDDQFVVLACDGIWDVMTNQEVCDFITKHLETGASLDSICEDIMDNCVADSANMRGLGCDNMTVMIVRFLSGGRAATEDGTSEDI